MIVVIGSPIGRLADGAIQAGGMACRIALAAAAAGRSVQLVGKAGDDATADAVILDLVRGGVGHVALLRDPARRTPLETRAEIPLDLERPDDESEASPGPPSPEALDTLEAGPTLEAADVDLGMRYLTEFAVVVLAEPIDSVLMATVAEAASWGDARLIVVIAAGQATPEALPVDAIALEAPADDPDGAFAALVGTFAAGLDTGAEPGEAFRSSIALDGWSVASAD